MSTAWRSRGSRSNARNASKPPRASRSSEPPYTGTPVLSGVSDWVPTDVFQVFLQHQPEPAHGRGGLVGQRHAQFGGVAHDDLAASGGGVRGLDAQPPVLEQPQAGGLGIRQGKGGVSRQNHVPQGVGQARHPGFRGLGVGAGQPMGPPPG
ncbi:hypothetical protein G6F60_014240 [Rhizopus arrhizus]|nr:hypothetical protein G6F60_014240 [Rhizopus arrhizus]